MIKRLLILTVLIVLGMMASQAQSISVTGGMKPWLGNGGGHFGGLVSFPLNEKWDIGYAYTYTRDMDYDGYFEYPRGLHKEFPNDPTLFDFKEWYRGYGLRRRANQYYIATQFSDHMVLFGYSIINNDNWLAKVSFGPHFSIWRSSLLALVFQPATITDPETGSVYEDVIYSGYDAERDGYIGVSSRIELSYKLFENLYIGVQNHVSTDWFTNIKFAGLSSNLGILITYDFK